MNPSPHHALTGSRPVEDKPPFPQSAELHRRLVAEHTLVVPPEDLPLSRTALLRIEEQCEQLKYERGVGSQGTKALLYKNSRRAESSDAGVGIVTALTDHTLRAFLSSIYNVPTSVTDIQVNRLDRGEVLPGHSHGDNARFAVLHFSQHYHGGRYYDAVGQVGRSLRDTPPDARFFEIPPYSMVLSSGSIFHGVTRVTSEQPRITIVMFLAETRKALGS